MGNSVEFNLNNTSAGAIAKKLDSLDQGGIDQKIEASVWNKFVQSIGTGNSIREHISVAAAMNSITTYACRLANADKNANSLAGEWLTGLDNGTIETAESATNTESTAAATTAKSAAAVEQADGGGDSGDVYTPPSTNDELKNNIETLLSDNGFDINDADLVNAVIEKHNMIIGVASRKSEELSETVVNQRLLNFAKGYQYRAFETKVQAGGTAEYQSDCSQAASLEELRTKYQEFGVNYVETYDQDGDGEISLHEVFYQELIEYYQEHGLDTAAAKQKAIEMTDKFKSYNLDSLPNQSDEIYNTDEMELFTEVLCKIGVLDADNSTTLSSNEAAAYLMSMAQFDDDKNNITSQEYIRTELALETWEMNAQKIMEKYPDLTQEEAESIVSFQTRFAGNFNAYRKFIETGEIPQ